MTDIDHPDLQGRTPHPRHVCPPRPLPKSHEGLRRVQIAPPDCYVPTLKEVIAHLEGFRKSLISPETSYYSIQTRTKSRAEAWHLQRLVRTGLQDLKAEYRPALMQLIKNQAVILGPRTLHEVDTLFAEVHAEAPWFAEVSAYLMNRVRADVAVGRPGFCPPPIILVGRPGDGKSQYARDLAKRLGMPFRQIDVGSGSAGFRISGLERGWQSAMPGVPVESVVATGVANPVMIVDEVDKAGTFEFSGTRQSTSVTTSLLQMLEHQTATHFDCPFYRLRMDMSHIVWIMTANSAANLPDPLRDRCRVFHIPPPTPGQILDIFDRLSADLGDDLREIGRRIILERLKTVKGFNMREMKRLIDTLHGRAEGLNLN
jgi:hypothetical protein